MKWILFLTSFVVISGEDVNRPQPYEEQLRWLKNVFAIDNIPYVDKTQIPEGFSEWGYISSSIDTYLESYKKLQAGKEVFLLPAKNMPWGANFRPMGLQGIANRYYNVPTRLHRVVQKGLFDYNTLDRKFDIRTFLGGDVRYKSRSENLKHLRKLAAQETSEPIMDADLGDKVRMAIDVLSATEKFDIAMERYDFPATKWEIKYRGKDRKGFKLNDGFCNGARAAGVNTEEPIRDVVIKNNDGISVTFYPMDIKALASAAYFYVEKYGMLGGTSRGVMPWEKSNPNPPNMALFDIILRSYLKDNKIPFFIDKSESNSLLNVTVVGYKRKVKNIDYVDAEKKEKIIKNLREVADGANLQEFEKGNFERRVNKIAKRAEVEVTLKILSEVPVSDSNEPTKEAIAGGKYLKDHKVKYNLYLDEEDNILDGKLKGGVDAAWFARGKGTDSTYTKVIRGKLKNMGNKFLDFPQIQYLIDLSSKE